MKNYTKNLVLSTVILSLSNYSYSQSEPIAPEDPVQQAIAPIQAYLNQFKPRPTLKPVTSALTSCTGNSSLATAENFGGGKIQTINGLVYAWRSQINPDASQCGALDIATDRSIGSRIPTRFLTRDEFQQLETVSAIVAAANPRTNFPTGLFAFSFASQPCDSASPANGNLFGASPYVAVTSAALGSGISAQGGCLIANDDLSAPPLDRIALSDVAVGAVSYVRMSNPLFVGSNAPLYFSTASQLPQGNGGATYNDTTDTFSFEGSFFNRDHLPYDVHLTRNFTAATCLPTIAQPERGGPIFGADSSGTGRIVSVISDVGKECGADTNPNLFFHRYDGPHLQLANYDALVNFMGAGGAPNPVNIVLPQDNALINGASTTLQASAADCAGGKIVAWKSTNRVTGQVVQLGQSSTCIITAQVPAGSEYITAYRTGTRWSKTVLVTSDRPQAQLTLSATAITLQATQANVPLTINWQSSDLGGYPLILTRQIGTAQQFLLQQGNSGQFIDSIGPNTSTTYTYRLRRELGPGNYETLALKDVQVTRVVQFQEFIGVTRPYMRFDGPCFFGDIPVDSRPEIQFGHNIAAGAVLTMNGQLLTTTSPLQTSYAPGTYVVTLNQFPSTAFNLYGGGVGFNHSNMDICITNAATGDIQQCTSFWLSSRELPSQCVRQNLPPIVGSIDLSADSPITIAPGNTQAQIVSWTSQNAEQIVVTEQINDAQEVTLSENSSGVISRPYSYSNISRRFTYRIKGVYAGENWLLGEKIVQVLPSNTPPPPDLDFQNTSYNTVLASWYAPVGVTVKLEMTHQYATYPSNECVGTPYFLAVTLAPSSTQYSYTIAPNSEVPVQCIKVRARACNEASDECSGWSTSPWRVVYRINPA